MFEQMGIDPSNELHQPALNATRYAVLCYSAGKLAASEGMPIALAVASIPISILAASRAAREISVFQLRRLSNADGDVAVDHQLENA